MEQSVVDHTNQLFNQRDELNIAIDHCNAVLQQPPPRQKRIVGIMVHSLFHQKRISEAASIKINHEQQLANVNQEIKNIYYKYEDNLKALQENFANNQTNFNNQQSNLQWYNSQISLIRNEFSSLDSQNWSFQEKVSETRALIQLKQKEYDSTVQAKHDFIKVMNSHQQAFVLQKAVETDNNEIKDLFTSLDIIKSLTIDGMSLLHYYINAHDDQKDNLSIIKYLLEQNADPNIPDASGLYPIQSAIQNGQLELVKILIDKGANINLETEPSLIELANQYLPSAVEYLPHPEIVPDIAQLETELAGDM